jgi:hypothetical protein
MRSVPAAISLSSHLDGGFELLARRPVTFARLKGSCEDEVRGRYRVTLQVSPRRECFGCVAIGELVACAPGRFDRIALAVELVPIVVHSIFDA